MKKQFVPILILIFSLTFATNIHAQGPKKAGEGADNSLLKRFDTNGDGKIDDDERRGVREKLRQMQNKPGARTPSGKTETVGNREVTEMEYASSDGQKIPCVLSMPQGNGPFPMLVTIHGGQGNRDLGYIRTMAAPNQLSPTINAFNEQPWAILAISYRSGNGALFGKEHDDVIAGIRFAKTLPNVDAARVGVVGGSHGGHLALVAAEKMGQEFLCVAVGSPWMTDPVVYMTGNPNSPPLSLVPKQARDELAKNGQSLFNGLTRGRGMSEAEAKDFLLKNSIEANSDKIEVPTLFVTSRGDDQAPHVLIEPMIRRMQTAKKEVSVYTAEKSPHGFYWARTVSAARDLRGEKTKEEEGEEKTARDTMIAFFNKQFARTDVKVVESPTSGNSTSGESESPTSDMPKEQSADRRAAVIERMRQQRSGAPASAANEEAAKPGIGSGAARGAGLGGTSFEAIAGESGMITRDQFKKQLSGSPAFASRPEIADTLFDKLDSDGNGALSKTEFEGFSNLRSQFGRGGAGGSPGMKRGAIPAAPKTPDGSSTSATKSRDTPVAPSSPPTKSGTATKTAPIRISDGSLVGEQQAGVRVFRGIPYAAPPVGDMRWKAPQPPKPWTGVREATAFGNPALQGETFFARSEQSEDCLFLNIWTPSGATAESKLPVLFWIHGGAFIQGSGGQPRYDGTELAKRGAVVISINYRLGPLGLFAHPALTAESKPDEPLGNYCLLDMIAALRWTRDNVAAFGGDPGNVTISGSSAGGTSCLFLMGIPQAEGLFHKAIIHSSGGIQNIQTLSEAEAAGLRLAERLGIGSKTTGTELRRVAATDVAIGVGAIRELSLPVKPIIDGRLVTAGPADTFAQGKQARIPVLIGAANGESGARQLGDEVATGGAFGFQRKLADDMVRAGQSVWMFQLTYVPPQARASRFAAQHGESVAYAFGTIGQSIAAQYGFRNEQVANNAARSRRGEGSRPTGGGREDDSQPVEESEQGREISAAMMEFWVAFMRDGKPSGEKLSVWPPYKSTAPETMVFGNQCISAK